MTKSSISQAVDGLFDKEDEGGEEHMEACSIQVSKEMFVDLREKQKNGSWLDENFAAIRREHPDMFVAVFRSSMLEMAKTLDELMERIHKKGIDRIDQIVIRYIPDEDVVIIL